MTDTMKGLVTELMSLKCAPFKIEIGYTTNDDVCKHNGIVIKQAPNTVLKHAMAYCVNEDSLLCSLAKGGLFIVSLDEE